MANNSMDLHILAWRDQLKIHYIIHNRYEKANVINTAVSCACIQIHS